MIWSWIWVPIGKQYIGSLFTVQYTSSLFTFTSANVLIVFIALRWGRHLLHSTGCSPCITADVAIIDIFSAEYQHAMLLHTCAEHHVFCRYMPLAQPIITNLIQNQLKLPNRLYQVVMHAILHAFMTCGGSCQCVYMHHARTCQPQTVM